MAAYRSRLTIGLLAAALLVTTAPVVAQEAARTGEVEPSDGRVAEVVAHALTVELSPETHRLVASDRLALRVLRTSGARVRFALSAALKVHRVSRVSRVHDQELQPLSFSVAPVSVPEPEAAQGDRGWQLVTVTLASSVREGDVVTLQWDYAGTMNDPPRQTGHLRFVAPSRTDGHIGQEGVYLSGESRWYPEVEGSLPTFAVEVRVPAEWDVVTQGREVSRTKENGTLTSTWEASARTQALTLVANRFVRTVRQWRGITIATYLFPEDARLADTYLDATERYLKIYTKLLGPYPFTKFAVVENFFPSGLGMPSFTLLGSGVIKRRYTQPYALGHEIVHSWVGNAVFNDVESGNWVEGLTTYLANYYYHEQIGDLEAARNERRMMVLGYAVYVWPEDDYPVRAFRQKTEQKDNAIGYQKAAMIFHMLRKEIGDPAFWSGVRRLVTRYRGRFAGWGDLEREFSAVAGRDLRWFFRQWVERTGAPQFIITAAKRDRQIGTAANGGYRVTLQVTQEGWRRGGEAFRLGLPVRVTLEGNRTHKELMQIERGRETVSFTVPARPIRVEIDPDSETFKRIPRRGVPPMLNLYVTDRTRALVLPNRGTEVDREPYERLGRRIASRERGADITQTVGFTESAGQGSVLVLGGPGLNQGAAWAARGCGEAVLVGDDRFTVGGRTYDEPHMALLLSCRHPDRPDHVATLFYGLSPAAVDKVARLLFFYGWQSYIVFEDGRPIARGDIPPASRDLTATFEEQ